MNAKKRQKINGWVLHVAVWLFMLVLPLFSILPGRPILVGRDYLHYLLMLLSFMAVFYANWFYLIRTYLSEKEIGPFITWNLVVIIVIFCITQLIHRFVLPPLEELPHNEMGLHWFHTVRFFIGNTLLYSIVVVASVAVRMTGNWYRAESLRKDMEKARTEAELQNLKSQLNPHFLFNTLNNIYSLIGIDQERAQTAVHDLGEMLRYVLYDSSKDFVPLPKEMDFLRDYIALMKIRLTRHVDLQVSLPEEPTLKMIAPMLFISPIENAFKHGVNQDKSSFIHINIYEEEQKVICDILNSNFPKTDGDRSGSGIGLKNLEQRLEMIYPEKHLFTHGVSGNTYETHLEIWL